jgi:hypothetical protein
MSTKAAPARPHSFAPFFERFEDRETEYRDMNDPLTSRRDTGEFEGGASLGWPTSRMKRPPPAEAKDYTSGSKRLCSPVLRESNVMASILGESDTDPEDDIMASLLEGEETPEEEEEEKPVKSRTQRQLPYRLPMTPPPEQQPPPKEVPAPPPPKEVPPPPPKEVLAPPAPVKVEHAPLATTFVTTEVGDYEEGDEEEVPVARPVVRRVAVRKPLPPANQTNRGPKNLVTKPNKPASVIDTQ